MASPSSTPAVHEADYAYYEQVAREVQEKQTLANYLNVTQLAFKSCVHNFLHQELTAKEEKCIQAVTRKYVGANLRSTARLGELQLDAARKLVAAPGPGAGSSGTGPAAAAGAQAR